MRHLGLFDRAGRHGGGVSAGAAPLARYTHSDVKLHVDEEENKENGLMVVLMVEKKKGHAAVRPQS
jgi:hypothetical protein